jgi:hypothetical protein
MPVCVPVRGWVWGLLHNAVMATPSTNPADQRIAELIGRWLASIDQHLRYAELGDAQYREAQAWPQHDRPTRWVLELARQKVLELKVQCEERAAKGDGKFAEALELMAFLSNLVGLQHIQRFIPLATPVAVSEPTQEAPKPKSSTPAKPVPRTDEATREMPRLKVPHGAVAPKAAPAAVPKAQPRTDVKDGKKPPAPAAKPGPVPVAVTVGLQTKIVADAIRLLKWGKQWHELAELIARIAERPPAADIRKILRTHKADIESKVARGR